jgi:hypothetical protein
MFQNGSFPISVRLTSRNSGEVHDVSVPTNRRDASMRPARFYEVAQNKRVPK